MFYYARSDTHYLLYIYDMLRNMLVERSVRFDHEKDLIELTIQKSKETSLSRYEASLCEPETGQGSRGWFGALSKSPSMLSGEQFAVYKAVHNWRDNIARVEDESPHFVMPTPALVGIAKSLPTDRKTLFSLFHGVSHIVRSSADELFRLIKDAKARGANEPSSTEFFRSHVWSTATDAQPHKPRGKCLQRLKKVFQLSLIFGMANRNSGVRYP